MDLPSPSSVDIILPLAKSDNQEEWSKAIAKTLRLSPQRIGEVRLRKRSIDARKKDIRVRLRLDVFIDESAPPATQPSATLPALPANATEVIVVGAGPAGLFAALRLVERGIKPIVIERGKEASVRRFDLAPILREGRIIKDSNYCFGEGGAGTFSDGKLYTRATKRGPVTKVYETFVAHGAPDQILIDSHPHIGSNLLPKVVMSLRESIRSAGGEVRFECKLTGFILQDDEIKGVKLANGEHIYGAGVILATGHSARDVYQLLHQQAVYLEAKPFAIGVRIEHPQNLIDAQQYHYPRTKERPALLPAASYSLATKIKGRGVHSFCMCPGGFIVPAATEDDEVVVNGMSLSRRDSPFANSGLVVTIEPEDTYTYVQQSGVLAGMLFQKKLEQAAKLHGGGGQRAPAQHVLDFLSGKNNHEVLPTSYFPGLKSAPLHQVLPAGVVSRMRDGLNLFGTRLAGFNGKDGQLIGVETRTSSPVRIPRDRYNCQHVQIRRLYPCGEGAGYAGGIVSAALDGLRCAEAASATLT